VRILIPLAVILAIAAVLFLRGRGDTAVLEASGTVEATEADLGFSLPGRIATITVDEGTTVERGLELATLDRDDLLAQRRAAAAQAAAARARLQELQHGFREEEIAQGRAALRAAEQRAADAQRDVARVHRLFDGGAVSQQRLDDAETRVTTTEAEAEHAREALGVLETGPRPEQIAAQQGVLEQAEATVTQVDAVLEHAAIRAPFDGIVTVRHREPGETVPTGAPILTLMNPSDRWVRIYVREDQVGKLNIGDRAHISADAYPERTYPGRIVFISNEAEFTPRNVQTTEERVKLVYRVKVQVEEDAGFDLKPGLPADVALDVGAAGGT
jgi:HlyD family secretion protein